MKKFSTLLLLIIGLGTTCVNAQTYHPLASSNLTENWAPTSRLTTNDDWSAFPSIRGFLGDDPATTTAGTDPQTILVPGTTQDIIVNQTSTTLTSGGVAEFEHANPVVALQGSGTADYPHITLYLNTTGTSANTLSFNAKDIDS